MSPFCQKVDSQNQLRLPLLVALIWLIMIFSWLNFFSLNEQRKEAKETRLAGALTGKKTSVFSLPAARVHARRVSPNRYV